MELNDAHRAQVARFVAFCKGKRERALLEKEGEKSEFKSDRLVDDSAIYNKSDVEDIVDTYHAMMAGGAREVTEELINLSAVTISQLIGLAEQAGLQMDSVDVAAIDQYGAASLASMAAQGSAPACGGVKRPAGALPSLGGENKGMAELEEENRQMRERYQAMQLQVSELARERSQLAEELQRAAAGQAVEPPPPPPPPQSFGDSSQYKEMKALLKKKSEEVKTLRQTILANGLALPATEGGFEVTADDD